MDRIVPSSLCYFLIAIHFVNHSVSQQAIHVRSVLRIGTGNTQPPCNVNMYRKLCQEFIPEKKENQSETLWG